MIAAFLLVTQVLALTPEEVSCPPPQSKVDFRDPNNGDRIVFCQENVDGKYLDRGERYVFKRGVTSLAVAPSPQASPADSKKAVEAVREIFAMFVPGHKRRETRTFEVRKCEDKAIRWVGLAMMKQGFDAHYIFRDRCDVQGNFSPRMDQAFPVVLQLRKLEQFTNVKFQLLITAEKVTEGIKYTLQGTEGVLTSAAEAVKFRGTYFMVFNPYQINKVNGNEGGEITVRQ